MGREILDRRVLQTLVDNIKKTFSKHNSRIEALERRVKALEDVSTSPWKMPFD